MSEICSIIMSDGYQAPPNPARSMATATPPPSAAEPGQPAFPEKNSSDRHQANVSPEPVQPLSNEDVQTVCPTSVQPLSTHHMDRGCTEGEQGVDSRNGQTLDRQNGQGLDRRNGQTLDTPNAPPGPLFILQRNMTNWTANQNTVLGFFRRCGHCVTNHKALGAKLGIPYGTVRHIIRRLAGSGYIRTETYKNAAMQGIEVWYCGPDAHLPGERQAGLPHPVETGVGHPDWTEDGQASWTGVGHPPYMEDRKIEREKKEKNLSIWTISKEQIRELWPHACEAGLYASHLQEIKDALELQGIENKPDRIVAQSLRFLDWQLAKGPIIDQHGHEVTHPVSYWRTSMKRNGYYQKPAGYTDPEEQALRQLADEENERNAALRALREARAEKEKQERFEELNVMLQELADRTTAHPLWPELSAKWSPLTRQEVEKNPRAMVTSPGIAATTRIALRELFGFPRE